MNEEQMRDLATKYYDAFPQLFGRVPEEPDWKYRNYNITKIVAVIKDALADLPPGDPGNKFLVDIKVLDAMEEMF